MFITDIDKHIAGKVFNDEAASIAVKKVLIEAFSKTTDLTIADMMKAFSSIDTSLQAIPTTEKEKRVAHEV